MPRTQVNIYTDDMPSREYAMDDTQFDQAFLAQTGGRSRSETPIEALMSAAPFEEPEESAIEKDKRLEPLTAALAALPPRERWVIEARYWRRMSLRQLGRELSLAKSYVARIEEKALRHLKIELERHGGESVAALLHMNTEVPAE